MSTGASPAERSGLSIATDTLVAPRAAFDALRDRTHWGWAFVIVCVLGCIGAVLQAPASEHVVAATLAHQAATDPSFANVSPEQQAKIAQNAEAIQRFTWLFYPVIAGASIAFAALVMLAGAAIARGKARYARLFGLAANVAIVTFGIAYLTAGILATLRGPSAFASQRDLLTVLPSLAWVVPGASAKVATLASAVNPFTVWSFLLLASGLQVVAGVARPPAYAVAAVVAFGGILFAVPFVK